MSDEIVFAPSQFDANSLNNYASLFERCFSGAKIANVAYLDWLYRRNPDAEVVGFDALVASVPVAT